MSFGTSINLSTGFWGTFWSLPSTGFVNPSYLGPPDPNTGVASSTGFPIEPGATLTLAFSGTYTGQTVVHSQTLDETGATGWFPVQGFAGDGSVAGTGVSSTAMAYSFPCLGNRHRIQVTALSTGTMQAMAEIDSYSSIIMGSVAATAGGGSFPVVVGNRTPVGYQQIVGLAASTALTVPGTAKIALITCEGQAVRWRDDGVAPTASVGMELQIGQVLMYDGSLSAIRFIQEAATATLNASFYA